MTAATNAQRQAALKARRKAAGLVPVTVWVYREDVEAIKAMASCRVIQKGCLTEINKERMMRET